MIHNLRHPKSAATLFSVVLFRFVCRATSCLTCGRRCVAVCAVFIRLEFFGSSHESTRRIRPVNFYIKSLRATTSGAEDAERTTGRSTHRAPHQPPRPRILSACTAVTRTRCSRSERCAESWASWEWRWLRCRVLAEEAEVAEMEGRLPRGRIEGRCGREAGIRCGSDIPCRCGDSRVDSAPRFLICVNGLHSPIVM